MVCLNISKQNANVADGCGSVMDINNVNFVSLIKKGYRCLQATITKHLTSNVYCILEGIQCQSILG